MSLQKEFCFLYTESVLYRQSTMHRREKHDKYKIILPFFDIRVREKKKKRKKKRKKEKERGK